MWDGSMLVYRCIVCGCIMYVGGSFSSMLCEHCGVVAAIPPDLEKYGDFYNEATYFRQKGNYEKALEIYDKLLSEDREAAEAYFGRMLCRYGVKYKKDQEQERWRPDCYLSQNTPIREDADYLKALGFAGERARHIYRKFAEQIDFVWQKKTKPDEGIIGEVSDELPVTGEFLFFCRLSESQLETFERSLRLGSEREKKDLYFVHKSSCVDDNVEIGEGTQIGRFCHIQRGARIGRNCVLGQNVNISYNVQIGDCVEIQNNVTICEGVELEDEVFCGLSCVFTNERIPRAGHSGESKVYRETLVKRGASIGANATIICGNTIGEYALVGAGAVVTKNVPNHTLVMGVPARVVRRI